MSTYRSPIMKQYNNMKAKVGEAVLLWRIGDFDEAFGADAHRLAEALNFTVTTRTTGGDEYPMVGYPTHARTHYLQQLRQLEMPYAICERDADGNRHITEKYSFDSALWGY